MGETIMPQKITAEKDAIRKAFLRLALAQDVDVDVLIEELDDDFDKLMTKYSSGDQINQTTIDRAIPVIIGGFILAYLTVLKRYNRDVAEVAAIGEFDRIARLYGSVLGVGSLLRAFRNETINYGDDVYKRLLYRKSFDDGRMLAQRLKIMEAGSVKTVRNIVAVGIKDGESALLVAEKIKAYVDPRLTKRKLAPWALFRKRFDRATSFVPKNIPSGSIGYNAIRIARTEINHSYRHTVVDLNRDKPWHKGWYWRLSASHPKPDICDTWAEYGLYKEEAGLPVGHPNCFCYIEPATMTQSEFEKELNK